MRIDRLNQLNQLDILNKDANLWGKISDSEETQSHQYGQNAYKVAGFPNPNFFLLKCTEINSEALNFHMECGNIYKFPVV